VFTMKARLIPLFLISIFITTFASAAITVPGANGTDGVLNITVDTVIDLSQAANGTWDQDNTANAGKGVYDATKWAVIFKYSSVTVDAGVTLTFINHPSRAPLVWLVSGNVSIEGTVSVDGQNYVAAPALAEPGAGGFRGAMATFSSGVRASAGFGPGGGSRESNHGTGGSYGTTTGGPTPYGNPSLVPLIGGSGGGGDNESTTLKGGGGGGGGAILIASTGTTTINGIVTANGGNGQFSYTGTDINSGGGSGGGVRIVTHSLDGTGVARTLGGTGGKTGGVGRIRIERVINNNTIQVTPDPSIVPLTDGDTALIWPPATAPTVKREPTSHSPKHQPFK